MHQRVGNLCLLLVVSAALSGHLQEKTLAAALPADISSNGRDFCLISLSHRAEIFDRIELPATTSMFLVPENLWLNHLPWIFRVYSEAKPRFFSSADPCYLYMSLQS